MTNASESDSKARYLKAALIVLALALLSAGVTAPFFFSKYQMVRGQRIRQMIHTHDMVAHLKMMEQFDLSLRSGLIEPRWFSEVNNGYGSATFNFYPRAFYYLTSLTNLAAGDWKSTLFIISLIGLASSGLTFYWLSRLFYSRAASATAALIYMLLPYHQIDLYWRGAIPEYIGFALLPLILRFAIKVATKPAPRDYAALAFFYGLHLMTHMPVGLMFSYAMVLFAITWSIKARDPKITFRIGTGMALGVVFSATYWLPALLEAGYIFEPASGTFPYHRLYIQPGLSANTFDDLIAMCFRFGVLLILASALVLKAKSTVSRDNAFDQRLWVNLWLLLGGAALFMCTAVSYDISRLLPKIQAAVPPFRWLSIANLFACLLLAASVDRIRAEMPGLLRALALVIVVALNLWGNFFGVIAGSMANQAEFLPDRMVDSGFIPAGATMPDQLPDTPQVELKPEGGSSEILWWEPESRQFQVRVGQATAVRVKTYNFRGWTAIVDGAPVAISSDQDGVQTLEVSAGTHMIQIRFRNTWQRTFGQAFSITGMLAIFVLAFFQRSRATRDEAARVKRTSMRPRLQWMVENKRSLIVLGAVILVGVIALAVMRLNAGSNRSSSPTATGATADAGNQETPTSDASTLFIPGLSTIPVAVDEQALNQLVNALSSQDTAGVESLAQSGKVLKIENRTRVRVLERASGKIRIRIIEGKYQWVEAWALEAWVR